MGVSSAGEGALATCWAGAARAGGPGGRGGQGGRGGLLDALGELLGQAAAGVRQGTGRLDEATGASKYSREAIATMTGKTPAELLAELKALAADNRLGAGAALGGLGALVFGTLGRPLAGSNGRQTRRPRPDRRPCLEGL